MIQVQTSRDAFELIHRKFISSRTEQFIGSVITQIAHMGLDHKAIDLALGAPDFPAPKEVKDAAVQAIHSNINQYANMWGAKLLRNAIVEKVGRYLNIEINPETEVTVTCGATEAMLNVMMTVIEPGDEVIVFEPFYENHVSAASLSGAVLRYVPLHPPEWGFNEQDLAETFNPRTKAIILITPNNPTGKVFSREELRFVADLCHQWNVLCVTDELYEHIVFDGVTHISMIQLSDMRDRTILVNSLSKTYNVTGWRLGYIIAPPEITSVIRRLHEFTTAGASAPLQAAGVIALQLPDSYYQNLRRDIQKRRDRLMHILEPLGFRCYRPQGAYYLMADISSFGFANDIDFAGFLIKEIGVAAVPSGSFYSNPSDGRTMVRFCFSKADATLTTAEQRLARLAGKRDDNSIIKG